MIRPFIIFDRVLKNCVIVGPTADVDNKVAVLVCLIEVTRYVLDRIAVCFFDKVRCRKGHGDNSVSDVGQVEFFTFVTG